MNFEVRQNGLGEYYDTPYSYSVYLDDKEVWYADYEEEQSITKIFIDFIKGIEEDMQTGKYIKDVLKERQFKTIPF